MLHEAPSHQDPAIRRKNVITLVCLLAFVFGMASTAYFNRVHILSQFYDQR